MTDEQRDEPLDQQPTEDASGAAEPMPGLSEDVLQASEDEIREELGIGGGGNSQDDIDALLAAATAEDEELTSKLKGGSEGVEPQPEAPAPAVRTSGANVLDQNLQLLRDVHMKVKVELGRGHMYLKDILRLGQGSVVELERLAGDPLDIYVNDKVIARGEVLVLNENFWHSHHGDSRSRRRAEERYLIRREERGTC